MAHSTPNSLRLEWRRLERDELDHELIWLLTSVGCILVGLVWLHFGLPRPECHFRHALGIPCPTCGATRATLLLLRGVFIGAVMMNPLYTLGLGLAIVYDVYAAAVLIGRLPRLRIAPGGSGSLFRWAAVAAIAINWGWLLYRGV